MKSGISIKEISQKAGVSIATVSRVINKKGRYSKETEERVMRIIEETHYEPNLVARGLRVQRMKNVGIIVPDITNEFFMKLENGGRSEGEFTVSNVTFQWNTELPEKEYVFVDQLGGILMDFEDNDIPIPYKLEFVITIE